METKVNGIWACLAINYVSLAVGGIIGFFAAVLCATARAADDGFVEWEQRERERKNARLHGGGGKEAARQ